MDTLAFVQATLTLAAALVAAWLGTPTLRLVSSDIISACAILAAFLVQVMLLLATILAPGRLGPGLFDKIADALDEKQKQALTLFVIYVVALAAFLAIKLTGEWQPCTEKEKWVSRIVAGASMFALMLAVCRTVGFLHTMRQLQALRHRLIRQEMIVDTLQRSQSSSSALQDHAPEDYSPVFGDQAR